MCVCVCMKEKRFSPNSFCETSINVSFMVTGNVEAQ